MNAQDLGSATLKWTRRALRLGFYLAGGATLAIGTLAPNKEALTVLLLIIFGVQLGTCLVVAMNAAVPGGNRVRPLVTAACWWLIPVAAVAIASAFIPNPTAGDFIYVVLVAVPPLLLASAAIVAVARAGRARGWWRRQWPAGPAGEV